ncbi:MAG: MBL fold metallo-hydrolase [Vicinamibacterales bacterium]|jgi:glyoxylase-like metal-dependent hydrolase (beta-lactamase superfamily II)
MTRQRPLLLLTILIFGAAAMALGPVTAQQGAPSGARPPGTTYKGAAFTFNRIADGVYHAVGTGSLVVMSNATIIEGDRDVLVVDSHVSPGGAWALREELKTITSKPIRWVVNSHYHFDHSHGNQIYGPEVEIIGHEFARQQILAGKSQDSPAREFYVGGVPAAIKGLEQRLAAATDDKTRSSIQAQLDIQRNHLEGTNAVKPTPPTMTLTQTLTLHRGSREIRVLFLGRGHTAGDVVVYLPKERIVATGDLLVEGTSYMGDAFFTEWIQTIEALKQLDVETVLPGHGNAFKGKARMDHWQAYLRDFWEQAQKFHKAGTPWEEAAKLVDLRGNAVNYPAIRAAGITPNHGMRRAYEILDGKVK